MPFFFLICFFAVPQSVRISELGLVQWGKRDMTEISWSQQIVDSAKKPKWCGSSYKISLSCGTPCYKMLWMLKVYMDSKSSCVKSQEENPQRFTKHKNITLGSGVPSATNYWKLRQYFWVVSMQVGLILYSSPSRYYWSLPVIGYRVRIAFVLTHYNHPYVLVITRASPCPLSSVIFWRLSNFRWIHHCIHSVRLSVRSVSAEPFVSQVKGKGLDPLLLLSCQVHLNAQLMMKCRTWEWMQKIWNQRICCSFRFFLLLLLLNPLYLLLCHRQLVVWKTEETSAHYIWKHSYSTTSDQNSPSTPPSG